MKTSYIIGIDPDVDKSGVATLYTATKRVMLQSLTFPELIRYLQKMREEADVIVVVEAGWLNKSTWHFKRSDSKSKVAAIGCDVGENHRTGKLIAEMAEDIGFITERIKPLKKCWKGKDGKITHEEIAYFIPGFPKRSNQETRDAALIAWNYANFPIKIKTWQR